MLLAASGVYDLHAIICESDEDVGLCTEAYRGSRAAPAQRDEQREVLVEDHGCDEDPRSNWGQRCMSRRGLHDEDSFERA
jgi:hypothetical protein